MNKLIQYIRNDSYIDGYPSISEQIQALNKYVQQKSLCHKKTFIDSKILFQPNLYEAIKFCNENQIRNILMYNYKTLSHRPIDRVSISKLLCDNDIKIIFYQ